MSEEYSKQPGSRRPSSRELRLSLLLPVAITLVVWLAGAVVLIVFPQQFNPILGFLIGASLVIYLIYWTRKARRTLRVTAILFALPAFAGISIGTIYGNLTYTLTGLAVTVILLLLQRLFNTPVSYRAAYRYFTRGDYGRALELIKKSIASRPDFWQSFQLRALIYLMNMNLNLAERDALHAAEINPEAHPVYNTLGQIYLAQNRFAEAENAYATALKFAPDYALYNFHLGLSRFRQEKYQGAAAAFAAATQGTLPLAGYDLQAYYYLGCSLEAVDDRQKASEAWERMSKFRDSLQPLQRQIKKQPEYPHVRLLEADLAEIQRLLAE